MGLKPNNYKVLSYFRQLKLKIWKLPSNKLKLLVPFSTPFLINPYIISLQIHRRNPITRCILSQSTAPRNCKCLNRIHSLFDNTRVHRSTSSSSQVRALLMCSSNWSQWHRIIFPSTHHGHSAFMCVNTDTTCSTQKLNWIICSWTCWSFHSTRIASTLS